LQIEARESPPAFIFWQKFAVIIASLGCDNFVELAKMGSKQN
jgi:hypothetical protein